jgi:hypothetical protein
MSSNRRNRPAPPRPTDPATDANKRILADRQSRIDAQSAVRTLATDLGLDLKDPEPTADNVVDFLAEEWDRKTFGDAIPTYTRVVYGPDPLLISCPQMKATIERIGLQEYANTTAETILLLEEKAVPDPIMQKGLRAAIARFGKESVSAAFRDRILKIPERTVEVEADRSDAMIFAKPMEEAVMRYGTPGMAPKFLSERCIGVLGFRGYVVVKDEKGDPVKVGTLIMGEIPIRMAEARQRHFAAISDQEVREAAEQFEDSAARAIRDGGASGFSVLGQGENVRSNAAGDLEDAALTGSYLNRERSAGFKVERQTADRSL